MIEKLSKIIMEKQTLAMEDLTFAESAISKVTATDEITNVLSISADAAYLSAASSSHNNGVKAILAIEEMSIIAGALSLARGGLTASYLDEDLDVTEANKEQLFIYSRTESSQTMHL